MDGGQQKAVVNKPEGISEFKDDPYPYSYLLGTMVTKVCS